MAAYPLTDAYYLQQQQQPPSAAPATVAQAKPGTTAAAAAATSIYERQLQQQPLPPLQQQPMLLQSSLVLTTAADHPSYGQQHQHSQQQHPPGGAGGRGGCPSSLRPTQVNILSSVTNVPLAPSHLILSHLNLPLHRPPPLSQPDRRKQLPEAAGAASSSVDPSSGGGNAQVSMMPSIVGRHHWSSSKADCLLPKCASAAAAGSSSAAGFNRRPRKVAPPVSTQTNIPCQPPVKANSVTGVGGGPVENSSYLAKTSHRQYQGTAVNNSISPFSPGSNSTVTVANGWSSSSSSSCAAERSLPIDDQPLDLTSVKKKRHSEESVNDDCPLDLSIKKRRLDDGFIVDRQQKQKPVIEGHLGFPYNRPDTVVSGPSVGHEINARLSIQRSLVDQFGQGRVFNLPGGAVLIPPSVVSGVGTSPRGHRQAQNPLRPKASNASPRSSSFAANPFPMFQARTGTTEIGSSYSLNEVPVIRTAMAGFPLLSQSSGSQSGLTSVSVTSGKSGSASFGRNNVLCEDLGNHFAMGQRARSLLQHQQQQHQQHQQTSISACSTTPRDNIPKMLMADQKMSLTDFNELSKYPDLNRASTAAAAPIELEIGSHLQAAPVIKSVQQHQQQQQGSFPGAKQTTVGVISCSDVNNKHKLNNNLHDALASISTTSIPKTASYGVRPNSRGSHAKQPRTPRSSVNSQTTTAHDASASSFFTSTSSSSSANITDQRTSHLEYIRIHDEDQLLKTPKRETYLVGGTATSAATKVELTWNKHTESMPAKCEMSFQGEEETKRGVLQTMQNESPKKTMTSGDVAGLNRNYHQQGFNVMENNSLSGVSPEILKDDPVVKTELPRDDLKPCDTLTNISLTQNWLDSATSTKWSNSSIGARCTETEKPPIDPLGQSYAVRNDRLEPTIGARGTLQPNERGDVIKNSETLTSCYSDGSVQKSCGVLPKEHDVSSVKKSHQCTTLPIVCANPPPQNSKDEVLDKDASRRVGAAGGCEACKWKESSDEVPPPSNSFPKILSPCRSYDPPREMLCDGSHAQAPPAAFSGDLIARQCTCRGFDRPGTRRIPVANVQPFMKEPADSAVFKPSADPAQPSLEDVQKREDSQTDASSAVIDDANAKAAMATGVLILDNQTVGLTYGDTPHLKEFVKFLEISAANPYRTPDEKLRETLGGGRGGPNESTDCDDRGRVKRQLLLHLAGPKGRPIGDAAKREGSLVIGGDSKRTPVEYIDEDNYIEPTKGKEKAMSETRGDSTEKTPTAENDDSLYGASALYQTMKFLDRQAEDRIKASLLASSSAAFSLSKTDVERKALTSSADEGATCGLNRASDRPTTSDVTLEPRKKKKQKQKVFNVDEGTEHLDTQRMDDTKSNIVEQRTRDVQNELPSSVVSATDETAALEAGDSYIASTSALDEFTSSSKPATKRKYQRKKTKQEELPGAAEGNHLAVELTGSKSSATSMSSSESTEVTPKKKRRRAIELLIQFNPPEEARDVEDGLNRSVVELNASSSVAHSSSSILLQVPQFLQQTPVESSTGRRRGASARRDGSIVRHARRSSTYDRNAAYEAELKQEAERRLVRRGGHGRGCRAAARHQQRMLGPHRRNDAEPRNDTPSASSYAPDDDTDPYHPHQLLLLQPQSQKVDDETTRDLFEYDDSSDTVFPSRRGGQGRKPVRKNGRIAFQYPEVFGRRRARGGLRGRSRPVRSSGGAGTTRTWDAHDPSDLKDFELDGTHNEGVTIDDDRKDPFGTQSIIDQAPPAAESTSIRGKVRSRVRVGGRGSRGHPRTHSAPRYDPVPPAATDSRPSCPSALGRDTSETRLHQVTRLGYEELVSYYLTTGIIHPNVQDNSGVTPLHDSCSHGYLNITRLLLDHGAHPNSKALDGTRPLHLAVANDHVEIVRLLLSYGADVTMTNVTGRSPQQMAKTRDMKQLLKGFVSDLSGGKGKEIPWQFPALFEIRVCDILADAPTDDLKEAGEVTFDLVTDNSLPVHRFVSESQKGPRNFHSVSDLCEDVKVEDFLLLNGDLTYVHVSSPVELPSSTEASSGDISGHPLPGPSSSSAAAAASLDPHLSTLSLGASTSSISFIGQQQHHQHRGWMSLSSSRQRTTYCSSATGVDRSSYVEIDVSLKGLLDIGVHRVPLHTRSDVTWPSSARFSCSRRKKADDFREHPPTTSATAHNRVSSGSSPCGSDLCPLTSFTPLATHTSKSELTDPGDVASGAEKLPIICETATGPGSSEQSLTKQKLANCQTSAGPSSSVTTPPRSTPLPPADSKGESGNSRDTLEQCRIVLCDIKSPSSSSTTDLNSIKCDARKDGDRQSSTMIHEEERDDRKKTERKQVVHNNDHTASANSFPVKSASAVDKTTTGCVVKASKDLTLSLHSVVIAASQRPSLGSLERGVTNGPPSSGIAVATVPHQRLSVFSNARRRAVPREFVDGVLTSRPEAAQSESLIPVLEKHGSDDETPPVENEEDVCGESYDDEREMPQLTLYA